MWSRTNLTPSAPGATLVNRSLVFLILFALITGLLVTAPDPRVSLARHTVYYHYLHPLRNLETGAVPESQGRITMRVIDPDDQPIEGARLLLSEWDGRTYDGRSGPDGRITIDGVPSGRYHPVAEAPGFASQIVGGRWGAVEITEEQEVVTELRLRPAVPPALPPLPQIRLDPPESLSCEVPLESRARRQRLTLEPAPAAEQTVWLFTPEDLPPGQPLPVLLAVYPSDVDTWGCVNIPLAAAGFAVIALSPPYRLEVDRDIELLRLLVHGVAAGQIPAAEPTRIAALAGSYSGLHVMPLVQYEPDLLDAMVLLGVPTDLFDMRRRFEEGSFIPPFGLDRVMVGIGLPGDVPLLYWRLSGAYHVSSRTPPTLIVHSFGDEIIPHQQSVLLAERLDEVGVPHELHRFEGASHYLLSEDEAALEIYDLTLDFLARTLAR